MSYISSYKDLKNTTVLAKKSKIFLNIILLK